MRSYSPRYALHQSGRIVLQLLGILLLVEAIFLAEKLTAILEGLLNKQAGWQDIGIVVLLSTPEVFNLAFPIALLIAIYRTLLSGRESREFVVLAGMGIGVRQFIPLMLAVGVVAQLGSIFISSIVEPRAHFLSRATLFSVTYQALRGGNAAGQVMSLGNFVIYAAPRDQPGIEGPVFVQRQDNGAPVQVTAAEHARLAGPAEDGTYALVMRDLTAVDFESNAGAGQAPALTMTHNVRVGNYQQEVDLDDALRFAPRGETARERTLVELLGAAPSSATHPEDVRELGTRLARSLLCFLAPLAACFALVCTNRRTQAIVLPGFCAILMSVDIAAATAVKVFSGWGISAPALIFGLTVVSLMFAAAMIHLIGRHYRALVSPSLQRS